MPYRSHLLALLTASLAAACSSSSSTHGLDAQSDVGPDATLSDSADASVEPRDSGDTPEPFDSGMSPDSTVFDAGSEALSDFTLRISPGGDVPFVACPGESTPPTQFQVKNVGNIAGPVTVKITGSDAEDFAATTTGCDVLAPGAICTIDVVFTNRTGLDEYATLEVWGGYTVTTVRLTNVTFGRASLLFTAPTSD